MQQNGRTHDDMLVDFNSCWAALPDQIRQRVEPLLAGGLQDAKNQPSGRSAAWNAAAQYA